MNKFTKMLGVTLLEVMLVLAVASIIILTSIRFYKSATDSSQVNTALQSIQAIVSSADSLAQGSGTYTGATTAAITALVGTSAMTAPWGSAITVAGALNSVVITFTPGPGSAVCTALKAKIESNPKLKQTSCASSAMVITYTTTD